MVEIKADNGSQISFGKKSPNVAGNDNKIDNHFDKISFTYGIITGIITSVLGSFIWKIIEEFLK